MFSLAKAVQNPDTGEVLGVILLDIRHDIIQSSINGITIGEEGFVFVIDEEDNMVYTPVNEIVYRVNPKWFRSAEPMSVQIGGGSYQIRSELSPYTGWRTVGVFSLCLLYTSIYVGHAASRVPALCIDISSFIMSDSLRSHCNTGRKCFAA